MERDGWQDLRISYCGLKPLELVAVEPILQHALRPYGLSAIRVRIQNSGDRYALEIADEVLASTLAIDCPRVAGESGPSLGPLVLALGDAGPTVIPVPYHLVGPGREAGLPAIAASSRRSVGGRGRLAIAHSDLDLVGLFEWAFGYRGGRESPPSNWSHYGADNATGDVTATPFLDPLIESVAVELGGTMPRAADSGGLVVTGDTDSATESELLNYVSALDNHGVEGTLLIRRPEQVTRCLVDFIEDRHSLGIHPYAEGGTVEEYRRSVKDLATVVLNETGRPPIGVRHHRFQWISPGISRRILQEWDVRVEFNHVTSNGSSWLGSPVGFSHLMCQMEPGESAGSIALIPTVVEDETFLYGLDYCVSDVDLPACGNLSGSLERFLEDWFVLARGIGSVNLHPEHCVKGYRRVQDLVLDWCASHPGLCRPVQELLRGCE